MIWPTGFNADIEHHLREIDLERGTRAARKRQEWYQLQAVERRSKPTPAQTLLHGAGDLLVGAGERLRAWSTPRRVCR